MTWYAVRINSSATRYARLVQHIRGPRNGLIKTTNVIFGKFEIEKDFEGAGVAYFIPKETVLVRDRKNSGYVLRTFPMLKGYAFVQSPADWHLLAQMKSIKGILGSGNTPMQINDSDIDALMAAEKQSLDTAMRKKQEREKTPAHISRKDMATKYPAGKKIMVDHPLIGLQSATVHSMSAGKNIKVIFDALKKMGRVEIAPEIIKDIAA